MTPEREQEILGELTRIRVALEDMAKRIPAELVTMAEAGRRLNLSISAISRAADRGTVKSVRVGRRRLIDLASVRALTDDDQAAAAGGGR